MTEFEIWHFYSCLFPHIRQGKDRISGKSYLVLIGDNPPFSAYILRYRKILFKFLYKYCPYKVDYIFSVRMQGCFNFPILNLNFALHAALIRNQLSTVNFLMDKDRAETNRTARFCKCSSMFLNEFLCYLWDQAEFCVTVSKVLWEATVEQLLSFFFAFNFALKVQAQ